MCHCRPDGANIQDSEEALNPEQTDSGCAEAYKCEKTTHTVTDSEDDMRKCNLTKLTSYSYLAECMSQKKRLPLKSKGHLLVRKSSLFPQKLRS